MFEHIHRLALVKLGNDLGMQTGTRPDVAPLPLDRAAIRTTFERRFTVERMARDYLAIYRALPGVPEVPDDTDESLLEEAGLALRAA